MQFIRPKADLIYGASGTRKTSMLGLIAEYVYRKYGKVTRLVTADGGGFDPLLPLAEAGIVEPWVLIGRSKLTQSTIDLACQGYWPKDPNDSKSPLVSPGPSTWERVGCVAFEGLTSFGDNFIRMYKRDKASLSQDPSYTYSEEPIEVDGKRTVISYSGGNQSYFGSAQDALYDFVMKTHVLPCEKVVWTALEGKGEEEGTRQPVYGPAIVGKKSTGKATQWFGNSLHIEHIALEEWDDKLKQNVFNDRPVMFTRTHSGKDKIPFPCKHRGPVQLAKDVPLTFDPPDMMKFYTLLDDLNDKALTLVKKIQPPVVSKETDKGGSVVPAGVVAPGATGPNPTVESATTPVITQSGANGKDALVVASGGHSEVTNKSETEAPVPSVTVAKPVVANVAKPVSSIPAPVPGKPHSFVPPKISVKKPS